MKHILILSIASALVLAFTGCEEKKQQTQTEKTEVSASKCDAGKCGEGKCGTDMKKAEKSTASTKKCDTGGKCGEGKCGGN